MEQAKRSFEVRIIRKTLVLVLLGLACGILTLPERPVKANSACYDNYEACHSNCDALPSPPHTAAQISACHSGCLFPYGQCVNQAELDKEGQIIGGYEEGQPMPVLSDFRNCLQNCPTCLLANYIDDPEGMNACMEGRLACKISCIEQFP